MVFRIHSWSVLCLVFCLASENSLNCTSGLVLLFFLVRCLRRFLRPDFLELTFSMTSVTSTALKLKFVYVTSFLLLGQLCDLTHLKKKNDFLTHLWNLKFTVYGTLNLLKIKKLLVKDQQ